MDLNSALYDTTRQTLAILVPEGIILLAAVSMMTAGAFVRLPRRFWCAMSAGTLVAALLALLAVQGRETDPYLAVALNDAFSFYARLALVLSGLILLGMAHDQVDDARAAEYFGSLLLILAGSMIVAAANELVILFLGLELVSIPTYLMLYLARRNTTTQEAATKYFFLSIFSSGLLLFGLAYLYGLTGISNLKALAYLLGPGLLPDVPASPLCVIALVFVMAGLGFRVAAVPFHFYAPDVYEGSPTFMAALLAWIPKAIGFLAIVRTLTAVFSAAGAQAPITSKAVLLAWILAVVTMTLGNTVALLQDNLKRLFAYSSIAHAGYLMIGVAVAFANPAGKGANFLGTTGILFYLAAYALMTLGAFAVILALSTADRPVEKVDDLSGLASTNPWSALAMAICLFSLAGIPPLAGFWGKFQILASAITASTDNDPANLKLLAVIGVLNSAVGAYYYLRIVVGMYLRPSSGRIQARPAWPTLAAVAACAGLTLGLGLFPSVLGRPSRSAAEAAVSLPAPEPVVPIAVTGPGPVR